MIRKRAVSHNLCIGSLSILKVLNKQLLLSFGIDSQTVDLSV